MEIKTVDATKAKLPDLISLVTAGNEVILTEDNKPIARIVPVTTSTAERVAGLHAGSIWTSADFDKPLSDDFWAGDMPEAA